MERLTEHHVCGKRAYMKCSEFCKLEKLDCVRCEKSYAILERLAAYEDTGLEPERVAELAQAEKEGRISIIPRHYWIQLEGGLYKCSKCHTVRKADLARDHYCPNCGFSMHGAAGETLRKEAENG